MPPKPKKNEGWIKWRTSEARDVLLRALQVDGYLFERDNISAEDAWMHFSTRREFENVVFSQFKERLRCYRKTAAEKPGWIADWRFSAPRRIIIEDLEPGGPLFGKEHISAEEAFSFYSTLPEFRNVVFDQFKERLEAHRMQANDLSKEAQEDARALAHDRNLFPRQTHNARGEAVFDMSEAKAFLREDVIKNRHTTMTPTELQRTRQAYTTFKPDIFKHRIYQEVRYQKYLNHLEDERAKKKLGNKQKGNKRQSGAPRSHTFGTQDMDTT
jgi:hypothetical protein